MIPVGQADHHLLNHQQSDKINITVQPGQPAQHQGTYSPSKMIYRGELAPAEAEQRSQGLPKTH
jgi:hypothetical protein